MEWSFSYLTPTLKEESGSRLIDPSIWWICLTGQSQSELWWLVRSVRSWHDLTWPLAVLVWWSHVTGRRTTLTLLLSLEICENKQDMFLWGELLAAECIYIYKKIHQTKHPKDNVKLWYSYSYKWCAFKKPVSFSVTETKVCKNEVSAPVLLCQLESEMWCTNTLTCVYLSFFLCYVPSVCGPALILLKRLFWR